MNDLLISVVPLLLLLAGGWSLRKISYFDDTMIRKLTSFIGQILVPCVIFTTVLNLDIRMEHIMLSGSFFLLLVIFLLLSWLAYRLLHIKRRFFIFFTPAFAFGLTAIQLFSTAFGQENMEYLVAMGVAHELFFALVYVTLARIVLSGEKFNGKALGKSLCSPLFCMVAAALVLNLTGLGNMLKQTVVGSCLFATISKVASITTVLAMIVVGYRLQLRDKSMLKESILYVVFRYILAFGVGYLFKFLVMDKIVSSVYFDHAFFTLLSQFGSTVLVVMVGEHCSKEDMEVSSNAFVINVVVGFVLFLGYIAVVG